MNLKDVSRMQHNDDDDQLDPYEQDMLIGRPGDPVTPTFLKKKVARPRYKSNMRIYVLPRYTNCIMYSQESMLKRDLLNGTLRLKKDKRLITCGFHYENTLIELGLLDLVKQIHAEEGLPSESFDVLKQHKSSSSSINNTLPTTPAMLNYQQQQQQTTILPNLLTYGTAATSTPTGFYYGAGSTGNLGAMGMGLAVGVGVGAGSGSGTGTTGLVSATPSQLFGDTDFGGTFGFNSQDGSGSLQQQNQTQQSHHHHHHHHHHK
ncbi:unnamed protein product [Ambrosiozyma monospora]|uniref:Unnamed protein product n=1 Tax=Ambrosiozyma monospora TaxID=43982 RepID=A0ACB5TBB5_AMBMO|nr:unnamed protein product [Ambrosiozyma monospora]